jgi:hypothetical protein
MIYLEQHTTHTVSAVLLPRSSFKRVLECQNVTRTQLTKLGSSTCRVVFVVRVRDGDARSV